ncbi:MAG: DinB family protein [Pyrinomonadaceae bacterium]
MDDDLKNLTSEFKKVSEDTRKTFGGLSAEQINWKPSAEGWSVGQCFDHLIKSNDAFKPQFEQIKSGEKKPSLWEKYSPLTGFFGNFLLKSLKNDARKFKAPSKSIIPPSDIAPDIIGQFVRQQSEIVESVKSLDRTDWHKIVVTSPFLKLMTYRLNTALEIGVEHEKRHFRQAERVTRAVGFPK